MCYPPAAKVGFFRDNCHASNLFALQGPFWGCVFKTFHFQCRISAENSAAFEASNSLPLYFTISVLFLHADDKYFFICYFFIHHKLMAQELVAFMQNLPQINIPRQSRGFFICGHSPRILARASRRASTVRQPRKFRYLPPVNGHFRSLAWPAALLLCPARTDIGCTPVSSLHFSLPCPHSTHGTRIPGSGISIFAPGTSRTASGCFFLSPTP